MAIGPNGSSNFGPVWGHFASKDLVEWRHLDVAIWNDRSFDATAIFTGSATIVNGSVRLIYSAVCPRGGPSCPDPKCENVHDCKTKNLGMASPASIEDPWLTNWTKRQIVFGATRDPSTAWQVQHPTSTEWRLTTFSGTIYNSFDFERWTASGVLFEAAECPSLFRLPRDVANTSGNLPSHVRKFSNSQYPWQKEQQRGDYFQVGDYVPGAPNTTGTWRPSPGFGPAFVPTLMDAGPLYASKDFQTKDGRRVVYGWITAGPSSILSLPRELLFDSRIGRVAGGGAALLQQPLAELKKLRRSPPLGVLGRLSTQAIAGSKRLLPRIQNWDSGRDAQDSEWVQTLVEPLAEGKWVEVMSEWKRPNVSVNFFVDLFEPAPNTTTSNTTIGSRSRVQISYKHSDLDVYNVTAFVLGDTCPGMPYPVRKPAKEICSTSQVLISRADTTISIHAFADGTVIEAFFQGGRAALTARSSPMAQAEPAVGVSTGASSAIAVLESATAWSIRSMWNGS